ncbi:MAG: STAS domain-containing protein [Leptospiraceae bacterium]|nr:STAS domain-containing protein [Leptospiraceae bacterium]
MSYVHREENGVDILSLEGSIDLYSTPLIKKFAKSLLKSVNSKIIISMENVTFVDSSGLGMVVNLFFECKQKGIEIKLASLSKEAKRVFAVTKLSQNYAFYESIQDAIYSFRT